MSILGEVYIGDGLYASYDGFGITLRAPRIGGDHHVYLEPDVLKSFNEFVKNLAGKAGLEPAT